MKIDDARTVIERLGVWKEKNRRRELAYIRRGMSAQNELNCLTQLSRVMYPTSVEDMTAVAAVLSAFVQNDCVNGRIPFGRALALLVRDFPSAEVRVLRVFNATSPQELAESLRPVLKLMRLSSVAPEFVQLTADAANFRLWRQAIVRRWSLGYCRGTAAEAGAAADDRILPGEGGDDVRGEAA